MRDNDDVLRGHIRDPHYERVSHGLFERRLRVDVGEPPDLRRLFTWLAVMPADARYTHVTGAGLRGWQLPRLPEFVPIFAATCEEKRRPRRLGLQASRLTHATPWEVRMGLPVEFGPEILLRCARDFSLLDMVGMVDSARRKRDVDETNMAPILGCSRPGVVALRNAWEVSTGKCESMWESHLYCFHRAIDVEVDPQVNLYDDDGRFLGRADLLIRGTKNLQEHDGDVHRDRAVRRRDLRRERRFARSPYRRRGYTAEDLLVHDEETLREIDELLGRPHDPGRLKLWRELVAASCLSKAGRDRLENRWLGKQPGR